MIRNSDDKLIKTVERPFNGDGSITVRSILNSPEEMYNKGRVFAHTTLQPGCSIGFHVHNGESETYYILRGKGEFNDNGVMKPVTSGDVTYTPSEQGHGLKNIGDEPLELIALILYE
jgi:mannose-6-phosphate isomerase-like protein (cupin superfamily)